MKIDFIEPPQPDARGGIEAALHPLVEFLNNQGVDIHRHQGKIDPSSLAESDLLHFHGLWQWNHSSLSSQFKRIPKILSPHGMLEPWAWNSKKWKKWPYYYLREQFHLKRCACIHATCQMEADNLIPFTHQPIEVIPLGHTSPRDLAKPDYFNARKALNIPKDQTTLIFLSRIVPKKGLSILLNALKQIDSPQSIKLLVIGDGKDDFIQQLKKLSDSIAPKRVTIEWLGPIWGNDRWPYLQAADLFCLPSHSENFGLAVLESLQVGTPVLTTHHTPWEDYRDLDGFHICHPEIESVKLALTQALKTPFNVKQRQTLSDWTHHFDWETLGPQYLNLYQSLTQNE